MWQKYINNKQRNSRRNRERNCSVSERERGTGRETERERERKEEKRITEVTSRQQTRLTKKVSHCHNFNKRNPGVVAPTHCMQHCVADTHTHCVMCGRATRSSAPKNHKP